MEYNFEPMSSLMDNDDIYDHVFNLIYKMNPNFAKDYLKIIFMDTLVNNVDRHNENYGFLRNKKTGKIIKMAPNFDNNMALISRNSLNENCTKDGFVGIFVKFLQKNNEASSLMKEIRIRELCKKDIESLINNIPIHVDEDIAIPLEKRFNYLMNKIKTID